MAGRWIKLVGTLAGSLRLGLSGVLIKSSGGSFSVRNSADSADAQVLPQSLGTGTRDGTKFLRDDGTWQAATASSEWIYSLQESSTTIPANAARRYPDHASTVSQVYFSLGVSASVDTVIDVKKNGVSIFSGTYPTITAGQYKSTIISGLAVALAITDYLTVDVISGSDGKYLTATIVVS